MSHDDTGIPSKRIIILLAYQHYTSRSSSETAIIQSLKNTNVIPKASSLRAQPSWI